jgi:hypothetical protein
MINPKQFAPIRQRLMTGGPITFNRAISLLTDSSSLSPSSRLFLSSTSRARSPQTESTIRAIENRGLRIVSEK